MLPGADVIYTNTGGKLCLMLVSMAHQVRMVICVV